MNGKPITIPKFRRAPAIDSKPRFRRGDNLPPAPKPTPKTVVIAEPVPTIAQSRSNGYIRLRRQDTKPTEPEPEWRVRQPTKAELMARR